MACIAFFPVGKHGRHTCLLIAPRVGVIGDVSTSCIGGRCQGNGGENGCLHRERLGCSARIGDVRVDRLELICRGKEALDTLVLMEFLGRLILKLVNL